MFLKKSPSVNIALINVNCLFLFAFFLSISRIDTYGVWFIAAIIKSSTISSTAIKRRPTLPITSASAPQVLSPKRLCAATAPYQTQQVCVPFLFFCDIYCQLVAYICTTYAHINLYSVETMLNFTHCVRNASASLILNKVAHGWHFHFLPPRF